MNADDTAFIGASNSFVSANIYAYCENNAVMMSATKVDSLMRCGLRKGQISHRVQERRGCGLKRSQIKLRAQGYGLVWAGNESNRLLGPRTQKVWARKCPEKMASPRNREGFGLKEK